MTVQNKVKYFSHRGSNRLAPENSKPAFDHALTLPIAGLEADIQLTADGIPILWHNPHLEKLGLPDKQIHMMNWEELKELDTSTISNEYQKFCKLFKYEDFLDLYYSRITLLNEIKNVDNETQEHRELKIRTVVDLLSQKTLEDDCKQHFVSSFDGDSLNYAHSLNPELFYVANSRTLSTPNELRQIVKELPYIKGICFEQKGVSKELINQARDLQLQTFSYTCNDKGIAAHLIKCGIDAIISDCPAELYKELQNERQPTNAEL